MFQPLALAHHSLHLLKLVCVTPPPHKRNCFIIHCLLATRIRLMMGTKILCISNHSVFSIEFIEVTLVHKTVEVSSVQLKKYHLHTASCAIAPNKVFSSFLFPPLLPTSIYLPPTPLSLHLSPHCCLCVCVTYIVCIYSVQKVSSHVIWKIETVIEEYTRSIVHRTMTPQSPSK